MNAEKENIVKMKAGEEEDALLVKMEHAKACQSPDVANGWGNRPLTAPEDAPEAQAFVPQGTCARNQEAKKAPGAPPSPNICTLKIFLIRKCCNYEEV